MRHKSVKFSGKVNKQPMDCDAQLTFRGIARGNVLKKWSFWGTFRGICSAEMFGRRVNTHRQLLAGYTSSAE